MKPTHDFEALLAAILQEFDCQTGTIHRTDASGELLELEAQIGVPEFVLEKITRIPFGKGIAGVAAERKEPVELCNLQADLGGVAKEDARKTNVAGSLAVPVMMYGSGKVLGTLGIGKHVPHDFTETEKRHLAIHAEQLATLFASEL
ncbi:GAF domain-containing protein [Luteolibacter sp. SL250]|uniref:GAF domain-containing protein n=1 Tax=Luteolibacter sp. SL250 TaxID=2995170 RepID=UPI00226F966A|nr:GAF domain-containing protein [Luteolibacter sp. SL250]WAC18495.1 GAF domain-containing protein [Luteolibacter sp. SL250]